MQRGRAMFRSNPGDDPHGEPRKALPQASASPVSGPQCFQLSESGDALHCLQDEDALDTRYLEFLQLMARPPHPSTSLDTPAPCSLGPDLDLEGMESVSLPLDSQLLAEFLNCSEPSTRPPVRLHATFDLESSLQHADSGSHAQSSAAQIPTQTGQPSRQQAGKAQHISGPQHAQRQHALFTPADRSSFQRSRSGSVSNPQQRQPSDTLACESRLGLHHDEGPWPHLHTANVMPAQFRPDAVDPGHGRHIGRLPIQHMPSPALSASTPPMLPEGELWASLTFTRLHDNVLGF